MITQSTTNYCHIFDFFLVKNLLPAFFYYIILPFIYLLAYCLFHFIFFFRRGLYIPVSCIDYRRKIVRQNLTKSFPEKRLNEIREIERRFYRYFCDLFLETFKTLTISKDRMIKHCKFNPETLVIYLRSARRRKSEFHGCNGTFWKLGMGRKYFQHLLQTPVICDLSPIDE